MHDITRLLLLMMASLVVACSDQEEIGQEPLPDGPAMQLHLSAGTRTDGDTQNELSSVHIFLTQTTGTQEYTEGDFFRSGNIWTSTANVSTKSYYIYGYTPTGIGTCTISYLDNQTNYEPGATLTFNDLDPVSSSDVGVVVGVLSKSNIPEGSSVTEDNIKNGDVTLADIPTGDFSYTGQPEGQNFVCLKLNHLYAAVTFEAKVGAEYDLLRTIRIKKMELQSNYSKPTAIIKLMSGTGISGDILWSGFTAGSGTITKKTIFEGDGTEERPYKTLNKTTAEKVGSGYLVANQKVTLITTYDILDKDNPANVVRTNCTAANLIDLTSLAAGEKLTLTLTVNPTYLYQLSEPDPDSPAIKIN